MHFLRQQLEKNPVFARTVPFFIFLVLTFGQGMNDLPETRYWFYLAKTLVGAWLVWEMRPFVAEMKWAVSWEAIVIGIFVFVMWVGIDDWYPKFQSAGAESNPHDVFGRNSGLAWMFLIVHLLGSTFVVPPLEEVFYRSFLYRYLVNMNFLAMPLCQFHGLSFTVTAIIFGSTHYQWLAGILCGVAYQWLVIRKDRLGDAMTAHAITNFLLGVYVIWRGAWKFW
jgi:CAAX prenyl protease-like protein